VYLPADDRARFGVGNEELSADQASPALRALMCFEVARARTLLDAPGVALCASLRGRARLLVAGFVSGGHAALDAVERADGDVLAVRCRPRPATTMRHTARVLWLAAGWGRRR
jgi:phytoene/squalene synthetase